MGAAHCCRSARAEPYPLPLSQRLNKPKPASQTTRDLAILQWSHDCSAMDTIPCRAISLTFSVLSVEPSDESAGGGRREGRAGLSVLSLLSRLLNQGHHPRADGGPQLSVLSLLSRLLNRAGARRAQDGGRANLSVLSLLSRLLNHVGGIGCDSILFVLSVLSLLSRLLNLYSLPFSRPYI